MYLYLARTNLDSDRVRALVRKLGNSFDCGPCFFPPENHRERLFTGKNALEVGEIAGQLAADQKPFAEAEEQVVLIAGKLNARIRSRLLSSLRISPMAFFGNSAR